jgi:hypothetical protein
MSADEYLEIILNREAVDTGQFSPVRGVQAVLCPSFRAGRATSCSPSIPAAPL